MSLRTYALAASLAVGTMMFPSYADAQHRRQNTVVVYKSPNGSLNVGVNGRYTNVTSYVSGIKAEQKVRRLELENKLRNRKPVFTIKTRR